MHSYNSFRSKACHQIDPGATTLMENDVIAIILHAHTLVVINMALLARDNGSFQRFDILRGKKSFSRCLTGLSKEMAGLFVWEEKRKPKSSPFPCLLQKSDTNTGCKMPSHTRSEPEIGDGWWRPSCRAASEQVLMEPQSGLVMKTTSHPVRPCSYLSITLVNECVLGLFFFCDG